MRRLTSSIEGELELLIVHGETGGQGDLAVQGQHGVKGQGHQFTKRPG